MCSEIALQVENISKCFEMYEKPVHRLFQTLCIGKKCFYKEFWALKDVNFEVRRGECIGIIGRNGAGKSTLLQIVTGTLTPTRGQVKTSGRIAALLELGSGFNPEFTGRENVYMNAAILGIARTAINRKYQEILDFADIGEFIDQPVKTYSSGMLVRLAFAVQILLDPEILIIDEALAVGDMFFQQKCYAKLKEMRRNGVTILFVSHDIGTVRVLCDRAVYLVNGEVCALGEADQVCKIYQNSSTKTTERLKIEAVAAARFEAGDQYLPLGETAQFRVDPDLKSKISNRSGSLELEFTAFDFYDQSGNLITECRMYDTITVAISFVTHADIPAGTCIGALCSDNKGNGIFAVNSNFYSCYLPALPKGRKFVFSFRFQWLLNYGYYFFSVGAKPHPFQDYFYDRPFNIAMLTVQKSDALKDIPFFGYWYANPEELNIAVHKEG